MTNKPFDENDIAPLNASIQKKVYEAELYLRQGLFAEADEIYSELLNYHRSFLRLHSNLSESRQKTVEDRIKTIAGRLESIKVEAQSFEKRHEVADTAQEVSEGRSSEDLDVGIVLKSLGLFSEAVQAFKKAPDHEKVKVGRLLDEIGSDLLASGNMQEGIDVLNLAAEKLEDDSTYRISILQTIADAHEKAGDKQRSLEAWQDILAIDSGFQPARDKKRRLYRVLKPSVFSFDTVCSHPIVFFALSLVLAGFFAFFNPAVKTVNNVDYFKLQNDPDREFYEDFKSVFGNDEFFVIAFEAEPLFSKKYLSILDGITRDLESLEEVEDVTSLANVDDIIGEEDYFEVRRFLEDIPEDLNLLASLKAQAVNNYLYVKNLLPKDAKAAAIVVETYETPDDPDYRKRILNQTHAVLKKYQGDVPAFYLGGWTTTNVSLSQYLKDDMKVFVPATYLLIALTTWLFFRNFRLTLIGIVNISVCLAVTRGLMGLAGITLNNVTSIVIPLVMALSLCDTIHIFSHLNRNVLDRVGKKNVAMARILRSVVYPCFLTTVTTAIGFLSLSFSNIISIKEFAWIASGGMVFEFIFSFFMLPPILMFCKPETIFQIPRSRSRVDAWVQKLSIWVHHYPGHIITVSCMVVLLSIWAAASINVETNPIEYFKKSSPVRTANNFVERRLSGVGTLDISLKASELDAFKKPNNIAIIEQIQEFIDSLGHVDKTISFVDFLKDMNQSFHAEDIRYYKIPSSAEMVAQYLLVYDSDDIDDFINSDYDHARISVRISEHSSSGQKRIVDRISQFINTVEHRDIEIRVTGRAVIDVNMIDAMVHGQIISLSTAALVISIIMFLVFRSPAVAGLSIIPNFLPIIINFGLMGALGIPLDTGTSLIAAVSLGIAVDDTIHFLTEYQKRRKENRSRPEALHAAIRIKGQAILMSSIILCVGFGIMVLSRFVPIIHFGLLSAIIMITALLGDLVVLPAVMLVKRKST